MCAEGQSKVRRVKGSGTGKGLVKQMWHDRRSFHGDGQSSLFFTNFPETFKVKEMWDNFRNCRQISEVFIPVKGIRKVNGSTLQVLRKFMMLVCQLLDQIRSSFMAKKIIVNLPRLSRGSWKEQRPIIGDKRGKAGKKPVIKGSGANLVQKDVSYASVTRKVVPNEVIKNKGHLNEGKFFNMSFTPNQKELQRLQQAFIGWVLRQGDSYITQKKLHLEIIFSIKATPMGSSLVLLELEDSQRIVEHKWGCHYGIMIGSKRLNHETCIPWITKDQFG